MTAPLRVFLSSPGDVEAERLAVRRVIDRINAERSDGDALELFRWEEHFYTAGQSFQDQVIRPSDCDLVICVFWKRLGTELPPGYERADGTVPTGTEYEFEDALKTAEASDPKTPDVLVYRKMAPVHFAEETLEFEKAQRDRFLHFWQRWFHSEKGHFIAAFQTFDETPEFETLLDVHLRQWLVRHDGDVEWTAGPPYRGLAPYDIAHAPIFFGRDRETDRARARLLANAVAGTPVLMVTGPSGSGKSSLIRAGLLARLLLPGGAAPLADAMRHAIVTPGALWAGGDWATGLAEALFRPEALGDGLAAGDFDTAETLGALIRGGAGAAAQPVLRALARVREAKAEADGTRLRALGLVLVIDQFEEIFRVPEAEAVACLELLEAVQQAAPAETPLIVISSMRSDFQHRLAGIEVIARLAGVHAVHGPEEAGRTLEITPPRYGDMRAMITGPARAAGLEFEVDPTEDRSLAEVIEGDAEPASLPALQFLLSELHVNRSGRMLTFEAYHALGGVAGVMATRGEAVLAGLKPEVQAALPRLIRALVVPGAEGAGAVSRPLDVSVFAEDSAETRLIHALGDAGLLISDRGVVRVAHESLLTDWDRVARQIETDRRHFEARDRLSRLCRRHAEVRAERPGAAKSYLLEGFPLAEGRELLAAWGADGLDDYDPELAGFIRASVSRARAASLRRAVSVAAAFLVIIGVGAGAWTFRMQAAEAEREAALRLATERSEAALRQRDWDAALVSALQASDVADTVATRSALLTALMATSPHLEATHDIRAAALGWTGPDRVSVVDDKGAVLEAMSGTAGTAAFPLDEAAPLIALVPSSGAGQIAIRADGSLIAASGAAVPFDAASPYLTDPGQASIAATEQGVRIAFADGYEGIWLRSCKIAIAPACDDRPITDQQASAVALSPDGRVLAAALEGGGDPLIAIFDLSLPNAAPRPTGITPPGAGDQVLSLDWSPDGGSLAVGTRGGSLLIAGTGGGVLAQKMDAPVRLLSWLPDGSGVVHTCAEHAVCISSPETGEVDFLHGHARPLTALAVSPDGQRIASASDDATVRIWTSRQDGTAVAAVRVSQQGLAAHAPDGRVAWVDRNGMLRVAGQDGEGETEIPVEGGARRVAWVGTGDRLAIVSANPQVLLWRAGQGLGTLPALDGAGRADGVAALGTDRVVASHTGGAAIGIWSLADGSLVGKVPAGTVDDTLSAFSLSADPSGRWLAATRGDDRLKIFDVTGERAPLVLDLLRPNTKAVAFAPDGGHLAALGADGMLYLWGFDAAAGEVNELVRVSAMPAHWEARAQAPLARSLRWTSETRIQIGTDGPEAVEISVSPSDWRARALEQYRPPHVEGLKR